jgi:hypothetical protein
VINIGTFVNIFIGKESNTDAVEIGVVQTVVHHKKNAILNPYTIPNFIA